MPLKNKIVHYLQLEAASGVVLFLTALMALLISNSPFAPFYHQFLKIPFEIHFAGYSFKEPVLFWINEGLMAIFFLSVGLELKREFIEGELSGLNKIILPAIAALGGMLIPGLIYTLINYQNPVTLKGWAIPVATDIAFALGVLSLFGHRVPLGLKLFLMTLAVFDDVGAIFIIAIFHTHALSIFSLVLVIFGICALALLNRIGVRSLFPYILLGIMLWLCVLKSGIHATVSGVVLAFLIPIKKLPKEKKAPLHRLEDKLHPWVAYFVLPLFAFANAGLSFSGLSWGTLLDPVVFGIIAGLFLGKQLGVFIFSWGLIKLKWAKLPDKTNWLALYGVALLCGIGFTMSLFLGTLAFQNEPNYLVEVRLGVLIGSVLSGIMGAMILHRVFKK